MNIQIGDKKYKMPENWEDLTRTELKIIFSNPELSLYNKLQNLFFAVTDCPVAFIKKWEEDATGIININGEEFTEFQVEFEAVLRAAFNFLLDFIEEGPHVKLSKMLAPPFGIKGFGEGFQNATFDNFALIDKALKEGNEEQVLKLITTRKLGAWERAVVLHHVVSCHSLIIENLPDSMKSEPNTEIEPHRYGWASVQMELAGEKLGDYEKVKSSNIWDVLVLLDRIDETNRKIKSK